MSRHCSPPASPPGLLISAASAGGCGHGCRVVASKPNTRGQRRHPTFPSLISHTVSVDVKHHERKKGEKKKKKKKHPTPPPPPPPVPNSPYDLCGYKTTLEEAPDSPKLLQWFKKQTPSSKRLIEKVNVSISDANKKFKGQRKAAVSYYYPSQSLPLFLFLFLLLLLNYLFLYLHHYM